MKNLMISAASEAAAENPLVPNGWEILVVAVGFAVLMFIVFKFVVPMFEKTFAERTEAIEGGIAKAEKAQAEATAALSEYKQQLTDARAEANRIREEARAEGARILADLKDKAAAESARITEQAQVAIAAERQAAVVSLRAEVGTLATTLAGRIVGESLNDDERSTRVVDRFLADLEEQSTPTQNAGAVQ
ncbi:MAG: F0F1 ATP synthase subunit B [Actinomycetota bacterium]|uniref:F0F1 ATP synthase subunit B n=1 Tax=Micrococcaceae TaxID=1268 RepID=UPI0024BAD47C|nr:F0F1 ATP synthase subunit B [Paenarthrobacter sp. PH39-S1]MDJ0357204.1 F0F1 ATP synthase subunit B [Paenarthrobacter sp. PH39-S1]MDQ6739053.1 F0F1 ATP synthase subunit B [Actinomycetota bacterium]